MKVITLSLVYIGACMLFAALFPTRALCHQKFSATKAWRVLGAMIFFFIGGYVFYGVLILHTTNNSPTHIFIASIMFSGGIFVYSVTKLAHSSIIQLTMMAEEERYRSLHDELTDLPNLTFLHDKIDTTIAHSKKTGKPFALFLIGLNRFKEINTTLGHFYGDFIIQQVALRLQNSIRSCDSLSRFGGDKFAVLLPDTDHKHAIAISNKITEGMRKPFTVEGNLIPIEVASGITLYPDHSDQTDQLLQYADIAMYDAQKNNVDYAIFDAKQHRKPVKKLVLVSELREAIKNGEMTLFFQPQISVINGKLSGAEALVRWQHPSKGLVLPDEFVDVIDQTGLSKTMIKWVLDKALQHQQEWQDLGLDINMSVNLSINNLHDYDFPNDAKKLLNKWQANPSRLTLEITEDGLMVDPGRVTKVVAALKDIGVNLSIDDFGTGYSSLAYLRKFPAREIKIDKSFVFDMLVNEDSAVIVKSTIDMAHNIGRMVVAEGVENLDTQILLKRLGCDFLQGFFFSKALPADEFLKWHDKYLKQLNQ